MKCKLLITSLVVAAIAAVPVASAAQYEGPGGPGAGGPVLATDVFGHEPVAGPGAGGPIISTTSPVTHDGLDRVATGIGAAFATGLGLVAAGMLRRSRHRSTMAMPQH
jgi:hypothetical protein